MKARIKATGEMVEVEGICLINGGSTYIPASELESFVEETPIDWEQRRFELAKTAMQGIISTYTGPDTPFPKSEPVAMISIEHADEMIRLLKGDTRR